MKMRMIVTLLAMVAGLSACGKPPRRPLEKISVDVLIQNLSDPDHTARRNAAVALGLWGHEAEKALPELEKGRYDQDWKVREAVEIAISQILRSVDQQRAAVSEALVARSAR